MAVPWLRLLDAALGIHDLVRGRRARDVDDAAFGSRQLAPASSLRGIEARLAGVVVAALKETFDRDSKRLELERQQIEMERKRAERALRLELLRQGADREVARVRFMAGLSTVAFVATLFFAARLAGAAAGWVGRSTLGLACLVLLVAIGASLSDQSRLARALDRVAIDPDIIDETTLPERSPLAAWCLLAGLAFVALGVLIS
ncbi:MAG TPA: hypothetical protein VH497_19295 [Vicinamibacterales bacterium]|jgi:hypothetical protein